MHVSSKRRKLSNKKDSPLTISERQKPARQLCGNSGSIWLAPLSDFNCSAESSRSKLAKLYGSSDAFRAGLRLSTFRSSP